MLRTKNLEDLIKLANNPYRAGLLENYINQVGRDKTEGAYQSGLWESKLVEIDPEEKTFFWFWNLTTEDENKTFSFPNENRQRDEDISVVCFSLLCTTFGINWFLGLIYEDESLSEVAKELSDLYHTIRLNVDKILSKKEVEIFYSIID